MLRTKVATILFLLTLSLQAGFAQQKQTADGFDHYSTAAEERITKAREKSDSFLTIDTLPAAQRTQMIVRLRQGEIIIEKQGETPSQIPGGLIHDWVGTVLIPKVTVAQVLALIQDYDRSTRYYSPEVVQSHLVSHQGDDFQVFMRLRKKKVVTVVLDTEYNVHYGRLDAAHQYSFSRSTKVSEIADPELSTRKRSPPGTITASCGACTRTGPSSSLMTAYWSSAKRSP